MTVKRQTQDNSAGRQLAPYPWLWRYVSHFCVGANSPAVQHAKLWAFHWKVADQEFLELNVSSTNLTTSAFKGQIQAGWSSCVALEGQPKEAKLKGWCDLIPFLDALGDSAGTNAKERTNRLVQLLGRADCPKGITFVASMPNSEKRGAKVLGKLKPTAIHILAPTIGDWSKGSVSQWSKDAGVKPEEVHLKWIDKDHPWTCGWTLTEQTKDVFLDSNVQLNHLKAKDRLHGEHVEVDTRWSHAKLYLLRLPNKKKRHLLLTSANWSVSAWGAGKESPRNFELGVLFETDWKWPEEGIKDRLTVAFTNARERTGESRLQWAEASWDGNKITCRARSTDSTAPINVVVTFTGGAELSIPRVKAEGSSRQWSDPGSTPLVARFMQGDDFIEVDVLDLRPPSDFTKTPLPEVDPAFEKALREAFLLQRYSGSVVDAESISRPGNVPRSSGAAPAANYSVQAWLDARAAFGVVDAWRAVLDKVKTDPIAREQVLQDGDHLQKIYLG